ncbi:solute carrier family 35 member C2 [Lucilia cuprina]|uniref:solute carrier family 35 member C2 n=1 Tax=Lucilia cuprina TaxID=7375 RepID=UPI001F05AE6E|nr:solute carrier family 35 member C2 [Lucilia cuprina]XP_046808777.1 solute carrier family 35 member C2 [Lucilia cuprina]XP_046808778.1 solute carrier family 35 member C2 [Lucilia cuprina]
MSHARYDNHKYARLNNQEIKTQRSYSEDENEEIDLSGTEQRFRYSADSDDNDDVTTNKGQQQNGGYLTHHDNDDVLDGSNGRHINDNNGSSTVTLRDRLNDSRLMQMAICSLLTILLYLLLSICLTFYQKALIKELNFPLTIVSYHLVLKFIMASSARGIYKAVVGKSRIQLDCRTSVRKMAPTGLASGIDIGFSNWALALVSVSLYTMTKSSTIVFILIFAILLGLEKKSWSLVFIVGLIAVGLFMFTYKSTQFDTLGFIFILVASLCGGIRWSLAQFVMQKSKLGLHNPIDMIYHMQPWMIAALLPFVIIFEGKGLIKILENMSNYPDSTIYMVLLKISAGATLAFFMEVSEFMVLSKTSSLTLSIAGIFKDIFQLVLAVEYNGDQLSLINALGLVVCLAGICCHVIHKYSTLTKLQELQSYDESSDLHLNEASLNGSGCGVAGSSTGAHTSNAINSSNINDYTFTTTKKHSSLTVPLLEETDTDDDDDTSPNGNKDNSSDVIFDILKRRDMQR